MEIVYSDEAQKDINFWKKSGNKAVQQKIQQLLNSIKETPYEGIGKPEPLKYGLSGLWSRRINLEHRIIYQVLEGNDRIKIYSLKGHYD
ncbi:Txe/YoeB family addiction module toxin [Mucilaginibacter flavidus]|uniref:Txe/YoeB family addiction module toxin n=1 Tax=Mucilaginibacter flavidus TaxID=2949309 RepID=UPI002093CF8B|nr:Txe/YoeB family addiction module toxin [Mucilaginibacter flavidus]MCO5950623.1 Txe/YoeB family addiction module toxin [Mucilaginibacter flavidus]